MELKGLSNRNIYFIYQTLNESVVKLEKDFKRGKTTVSMNVFGYQATAVIPIDKEDIDRMKANVTYVQAKEISDLLRPIAELIESSSEFESVRDIAEKFEPETETD